MDGGDKMKTQLFDLNAVASDPHERGVRAGGESIDSRLLWGRAALFHGAASKVRHQRDVFVAMTNSQQQSALSPEPETVTNGECGKCDHFNVFHPPIVPRQLAGWERKAERRDLESFR